MLLDFAFLADSAQVAGGRLYVLGGALDRLWALKVPVVHPLMTLVMRFELTPAEVSRAHRLEVLLLDADGNQLSKISGELKVARADSEDSWRPATPLLTLNLFNTKFEHFGSYAMEIVVNGTSMKSLSFEVLEKSAPPDGGASALPS